MKIIETTKYSKNDIDKEMALNKADMISQFRDKTSDALTIAIAKKTAKTLKIKYQDILKDLKPVNNIRGTKTWDREGNIN